MQSVDRFYAYNYVSKWLSNGIYEWRDKYAVAKGERRSTDRHDVLTGF